MALACTKGNTSEETRAGGAKNQDFWEAAHLGAVSGRLAGASELLGAARLKMGPGRSYAEEVMHCALYRSQAGALERRCQAALAVRGHAHCFLLKELKKPSSCRDVGAQGRS